LSLHLSLLALNQAFHYSDESPINLAPSPFCAPPPPLEGTGRVIRHLPTH
jgi:hypothetical protein